MDLVASLLLKLILAAVAALPPPKALGLKVSKGGLKLRILAVLDGLLPQCIGESPKPSQWTGLGWIFDKGKVLIHDGTLELRPRVDGLLYKNQFASDYVENTYASSKSTEMHLETSLYEEPLQSCPFLESLGRPLTVARTRAATTTNAFMFVLEVVLPS